MYEIYSLKSGLHIHTAATLAAAMAIVAANPWLYFYQ